MIANQNFDMKWYHHCMLQFPTQMMIVLIAIIVTVVQFGIYEAVQDDIVLFEDSCDVTMSMTNDLGETHRDVVATCGDERIPLRQFEAPYLYAKLVDGLEPDFQCKKTVSEYLRHLHWECSLDGSEPIRWNYGKE